MTDELSLPLDTMVTPDHRRVGGKAASLIRMTQVGFRVPGGAVLTSVFFAPWVERLTVTAAWRDALATLESSDASGLRAACSAAKWEVAKLTLTQSQRRHLDRIARATENETLAVRSSSPEEDLHGASFAGLYETVLNVSPDALEQAVRTCFASCLDERVLLYKRERGFSIAAPSIAVVVQKQIRSEISGVGFSINPLTNDFDEALINASWGQGEALVSGQIDPDRYVVDKVSGATLESGAGGKGGERSSEMCLDTAQLAELMQTLGSLEALFESPVDVEWAFADDRLHVLQARPATGYVPLPQDMQTLPGEQRQLYVDAALSKGLTINGAITPLTSDLFLRLYRLAAQALLGSRDDRPDPQASLFTVTGSRLYVNFSNLAHLVNTKMLISRARMTDAWMADLFETQNLDRYRPLKPPRGFGVVHLAANAVKIFWSLRGLLAGVLRPLLNRDAFVARYHSAVASFEETFSRAPDLQVPIDEFLRGYYTALLDAVREATAPALLNFVFFGTERLEKLVDRKSESDLALVDTIKRGYSGDLVVEMGTAMYHLSTLLVHAEFDDLDALAAKLERRELSAEFLDTWDEFIRRFGCRGPMEMEIANPKYADDPKIALHQIATIARGAGAFDPGKIHLRHVAEREAAYAELHAKLKGRKRRKLERCYRNIVDFGGARDTPKYHIVMINMRIRERVLVCADELLSAGRLDTREQVFELTFADLEEAAANPELDLRAQVHERGRYYRQVKANVAQFPQMIDSEAES